MHCYASFPTTSHLRCRKDHEEEKDTEKDEDKPTKKDKKEKTAKGDKKDDKITHLSLPLARVKKIMKIDKDVKLISSDAALLVGKATVLITLYSHYPSFAHLLAQLQVIITIYAHKVIIDLLGILY